jgi:hypothetical protein
MRARNFTKMRCESYSPTKCGRFARTVTGNRWFTAEQILRMRHLFRTNRFVKFLFRDTKL